MSRLLRSLRPSPALLVALLALVVATGGTAYAAVELRQNSVLSKHIKNGQVKTKDLANASVTGAKVKDGSLTATEFAPGQLPSGSVDTVTVLAVSSPIPAGDFGGATAYCPAGMEAIGGGVEGWNVWTMVVTASFPYVGGNLNALDAGQHPAATGWRAFVRNNDASPRTMRVMAVCAE